MIYDTIIIGGGPAGLTAALYANRAGLTNTLIEKLYVGGQVSNTYEVDNYPGFSEISGSELMMKIDEHAKKHGANVVYDEVVSIETTASPFKIQCNNETFETKTIILTTGAKPRLLDVPGEKEFSGRGVSYCATCDGAFYRNKTVAVLGSGNTAIEDAIFLARICKKVYLISRSNRFKGEKKIFDHLQTYENVELIYNHSAKEIMGETTVNKMVLYDVHSKEEMSIDLDGIFVAVGVVPHSNLLEHKVETDGQGYIVTDGHMNTSVPGIFAAGDARNTPLRQIVTAASDGAIAAYYASLYIAQM